MGPGKRKSVEGHSAELTTPQKQQRENGSISIDGDDIIACVHDVSYPVNYIPNPSSKPRENSTAPAKEFPFTLDPFQTEAIKCLDNGVRRLCRHEKENLCLYGLPNEQWEVDLPAEAVPPLLPEPALGINFARDGMQEKDWLPSIVMHGCLPWLFILVLDSVLIRLTGSCIPIQG